MWCFTTDLDGHKWEVSGVQCMKNGKDFWHPLILRTSAFDCSNSFGCTNAMREISFRAMCRPFGKHKRYAAAIEASHNEWVSKVADHVISDSSWKHYGNSSSNSNNNSQNTVRRFCCNISLCEKRLVSRSFSRHFHFQHVFVLYVCYHYLKYDYVILWVCVCVCVRAIRSIFGAFLAPIRHFSGKSFSSKNVNMITTLYNLT